MTTALPWKTALIAGAGSQIGVEIARQLSQAGVTTSSHAVTDAAAVANAVRDMERRSGAIDLAMFVGGLEPPMNAQTYNAATALDVMNRNYNAALYGLGAVMPGMIERRKGCIALISSVAGYRGLPGKAAHSPSHAALITLVESLKLDLEYHGINVSIINPGFPGPTSPVSDVDAASRVIAGLARGRYEIAFPWKSVLAMKLYRMMPNTLFFWLSRRA